MVRRIYIVAKCSQIDQAVLDAAEVAGCSEVANGIPSALAGIVTEDMLPHVYEELPALSPSPVVDWVKEWKDAKTSEEKISVIAKRLELE